MAKIVLFGATGFTGRLCAQALVASKQAPVLAGRSQSKLDALQRELGTQLETRVASSDEPASVSALLDAGDVLLTTVGPFQLYGSAALNAALDKRAHYIDSTGEPGFIRRVFMQEHTRAEAAGSLLVTGFGYDYVPGNLAAGMALRNAGGKAARVDVGYFISGSSAGASSLSQGTLYSSRLAALYPGMEWSGGQLIERYSAVRVRDFVVRGKTRAGVSLGATEHYSLPKAFPQLRDVNVYLGWYGKASYNMSRGARVLAAIRKTPLIGELPALLMRLGPGSQGEGPDAASRANVRTQIVAITYDANDVELGRVELDGDNPYDFTAKILAWGAAQTLAGKQLATGARGPVEAFGLDALEAGCALAGLRVASV